MTREEIEREIFKDLCVIAHPSLSRDEATAYVEEYKPITEAMRKQEATRLYDEVLLRYGGVHV